MTLPEEPLRQGQCNGGNGRRQGGEGIGIEFVGNGFEPGKRSNVSTVFADGVTDAGLKPGAYIGSVAFTVGWLGG